MKAVVKTNWSKKHSSSQIELNAKFIIKYYTLRSHPVRVLERATTGRKEVSE